MKNRIGSLTTSYSILVFITNKEDFMVPIDDLIPKHLQTDVDAILDYYRNNLRQARYEEAVRIWNLMYYLDIADEKIPLLENLVKMIYAIDEHVETRENRFTVNLVYPKHIWGKTEFFAVLPEHVEINRHIKYDLSRKYDPNIRVRKNGKEYETQVFIQPAMSFDFKYELEKFMAVGELNSILNFNKKAYLHKDIFYRSEIIKVVLYDRGFNFLKSISWVDFTSTTL